MARMVFIFFLAFALLHTIFAKFGDKIKGKDLMRKSIVFDKMTPDVFYCPTHKPSIMNKLIVRSRPLHKLCEYEGRPIPVDYKPDCYDNVDESNYACREKYRIMTRKYPPGSPKPFNSTRLRHLDLQKQITS